LLITDFLVFLVGKKYGRRLVQHRRFGKWLSPEKLLKLEETFRRRGSLVFLFGRHILGLRTPIFLAAGVMRMSVTRFLVVDAATILLTLALIWGGAGFLGDSRVQMLKAGATELGPLAMAVFLILFAGWIGYKWQKRRMKDIIYRVKDWRIDHEDVGYCLAFGRRKLIPAVDFGCFGGHDRSPFLH
jgi:membrane protein DedA with SNARE-associated domain